MKIVPLSLIPSKLMKNEINFTLEKKKYINIRWRYGYAEINTLTKVKSVKHLQLNTGLILENPRKREIKKRPNSIFIAQSIWY
jgi:hypothetical protein